MKKILSILVVGTLVLLSLGASAINTDKTSENNLDNEGSDPLSVIMPTLKNIYKKTINTINTPEKNSFTGYFTSTFFGGTNKDADYYTGTNVAVDNLGNIIIAGSTRSRDFPITENVYSTGYKGSSDIFVTKFKSDLSDIIFSTIIGGSSTDEARGIELDSEDNIYITGMTESEDFPVSDNAYMKTFQGSSSGPYGDGDIFVFKIDTNCNSLLSSTYLGGSNHEACHCIVIDDEDNIYLSGATSSNDFPTSQSAYDKSYQSGGYFGEDVFVSKIDSELSTLLASTYIGGSADDFTEAILLNSDGDVCISGWLSSVDYPVTTNAYDKNYNGGYYDGFVSKLNSDLSTLKCSTYLGGSNWDFIYSMVEGENNEIFVSGHTASTNYPTSDEAFLTNYQGTGGAGEGDDVFISRLSDDFTTLISSTYLGGSDWENGFSLAINSEGDIYSSGTTSSNDYPISTDSFINEYKGGSFSKGDVYISKLSYELDELIASTYLGQTKEENMGQIIIDENKVIISGSTSSKNFPVDPNSYNNTYNGGTADIFVTILDSELIGFKTPYKPHCLDGTINGKTGTEYIYTAKGLDPNSDEIYYQFDWGDSKTSEWLGPYDSGKECTTSHTWTKKGSYNVKVKIKDENNLESEWSDLLSVSMPKGKTMHRITQNYLKFLIFDIISKCINHIN